MDATDCAIEGTVICASRAEGFVDRVGSACVVAASGRGGMARNRAWPAKVAASGAVTGFLDVTAAPLATGCFAPGLPLPAGVVFFAAAAGVLAGAFFGGTGLAGDFAAAFAGAFFTGIFAAGFAAGFFGAGFAALAAFAGVAAGFALGAGLVALAPTFG